MSPARHGKEGLLFYAAVAALAAAAFAWVQYATPYIPEYDGYYHIKFAQLLREQGFLSEFPWLPLTTFAHRFSDMHLLFHYLLVPFTFPGLMQGAKLYAVVSSVLVVLVFAWVLRREGIPWVPVWLLGLLTSSSLLYRFSLPRTSQLSILLLLAGLRLLWTRRLVWLAALAFLYVWLYTAFSLLLVLAGLHLLARLLTREPPELESLGAVVLGIAAGLLLNPYFPDNLWYVYAQTVLISGLQRIPMGGEWFPFDTWFLFKENALVFVFLFLAVFFSLFEKRGRDSKTVTLFFVTALFLFLTWKSRRFVEYFVPFGILFSGFALKETLLEAGASARGRRWVNTLLAFVLLLLAVAAGQALKRTAREVEINTLGTMNPLFEGCANWLQENTPAESLVFHADWDDFPALFFFNTHNRYIVGMDPNFLYLQDPKLWHFYAAITLGKYRNPSKLVRETFGAGYLFSDKQHKLLLKNLYDEGKAVPEYEDDACVVYRLTAEQVR